MSSDIVYSNVSFNAKKSKSAFGGDDDSDDIDYTLIDFTTSGDQRRRQNAAHSETVTYSAVKTPQSIASKQLAKREGAESDDGIYSKISHPHRGGFFNQCSAQHNEPPTHSGHVPAVFTAQSDPVAMTMTPVRDDDPCEGHQTFLRPTFLLFLSLLFLSLTVILGVLYSLEERAHTDTMGKYESLQSSHTAVQDQLSLSRRDLSEALGSVRDLNISYGRLTGEKTSLESQLNGLNRSYIRLTEQKILIQNQVNGLNNSYIRLTEQKILIQSQMNGVSRNWTNEKSKNHRLSREKEEKQGELRNIQSQLDQQTLDNKQLKQEQKHAQEELQNTRKGLDEQKTNNVLLFHIKDSIEAELKSQATSFKTTDDVRNWTGKLSSLLQALENGCSFGWDPFGGKCYLFSSENNTWSQSSDACKDKGGHLVIINTTEEWRFLKEKAPGTSDSFYWIGLTDSEEEGKWRWVDNKVVDLSQAHWTSKEPDNWTDENRIPEGEDCARTNAKEGIWQDAFCDNTFKFICEMTAVAKS
ncbi:CD209 antigen-like [Clupea harengus]|uniref:CD209 antigen-like n=1 Tax=Clupea harengus TaxID=7950 RepID=A0A8M1KXI1_CLUHA|nr:CD209 antigen-like [Clupea harengus]